MCCTVCLAPTVVLASSVDREAICAASDATVLWLNTLDTSMAGRSCDARTIATRRIARRELPPERKKSLRVPSRSFCSSCVAHAAGQRASIEGNKWERY